MVKPVPNYLSLHLLVGHAVHDTSNNPTKHWRRPDPSSISTTAFLVSKRIASDRISKRSLEEWFKPESENCQAEPDLRLLEYNQDHARKYRQVPRRQSARQDRATLDQEVTQTIQTFTRDKMCRKKTN
ncbi:MAG: hypothetical protein ACI87E_002054 [Mariniblastus sp.]